MRCLSLKTNEHSYIYGESGIIAGISLVLTFSSSLLFTFLSDFIRLHRLAKDISVTKSNFPGMMLF